MFWLGFRLLQHGFGLQKFICMKFLIKMTPVQFCIFEKCCKIFVFRFCSELDFLKNYFLEAKIMLQKAKPQPKPRKFASQKFTAKIWVQKPKPWFWCDPIFNRQTFHLTLPIDRSRSQLFITFFLARFRSLNRPKRPLLFFIFFSFLNFFLKILSWVPSRQICFDCNSYFLRIMIICVGLNKT